MFYKNHWLKELAPLVSSLSDTVLKIQTNKNSHACLYLAILRVLHRYTVRCISLHCQSRIKESLSTINSPRCQIPRVSIISQHLLHFMNKKKSRYQRKTPKRPINQLTDGDLNHLRFYNTPENCKEITRKGALVQWLDSQVFSAESKYGISNSMILTPACPCQYDNCPLIQRSKC